MTFQEALKLTTGYSYFLKVIFAKRDKDLWGRKCKHCIHGTISLHSPHSATHHHPTPPAIWYMIYTVRKSRPTAEIFQDFPYNWHVYKPQKFPISKKVRVFTCLTPSQGMFLQAELFSIRLPLFYWWKHFRSKLSTPFKFIRSIASNSHYFVQKSFIFNLKFLAFDQSSQFPLSLVPGQHHYSPCL